MIFINIERMKKVLKIILVFNCLLKIRFFLFFTVLFFYQASSAIIPFGFVRRPAGINCGTGSPAPGALCIGGTYYLGTLNPGATSGTGTDIYMTTPGGCGDIPFGSISGGSGYSAYALSDFTPSCSGTDILNKYWNDGSANYAVVPGLTDYADSNYGVGKGSLNLDMNYGSTNTTNIVAVTAAAGGGYHSAARYCDRLSYGGYSDWYLPNRYELNLFFTNKAAIPGLDKTGNWYWSSTEYNSVFTWIQKFDDGNQHPSGTKNINFMVRCIRRLDPCTEGIPTPGALCKGGAIYLGSLSPGAILGSGTDKYMTTPGGCGDIPAGSISGGSGSASYTLSDFTPTCSGTDSVTKYWNDGSYNGILVPGLTNYTYSVGTGLGSINKDDNYGSTNTTNIVLLTAAASGGPHAAARYCDKLVYGGYSDWYLPNRYELNLMFTNKASISGLDTSGTYYSSSTGATTTSAWSQRFNDGQQVMNGHYGLGKIRCVRKF